MQRKTQFVPQEGAFRPTHTNTAWTVEYAGGCRYPTFVTDWKIHVPTGQPGAMMASGYGWFIYGDSRCGYYLVWGGGRSGDARAEIRRISSGRHEADELLKLHDAAPNNKLWAMLQRLPDVPTDFRSSVTNWAREEAARPRI